MGNVIKKSLVGIVIGGILFGATNALGFPFVFQVLFFGYAMLGAVVFIILDLPPLKPISGEKLREPSSYSTPFYRSPILQVALYGRSLIRKTKKARSTRS
jgi:hypothetical protein